MASTADTRSNSSKDHPMSTTEDIPLFSCRPEKSENISSVVDTWCAATVDPGKKNEVSSAYCSNEVTVHFNELHAIILNWIMGNAGGKFFVKK